MMKDDEKVAGKTTAIVAYLTLIGALIAITMNNEPKHTTSHDFIQGRLLGCT